MKEKKDDDESYVIERVERVDREEKGERKQGERRVKEAEEETKRGREVGVE